MTKTKRTRNNECFNCAHIWHTSSKTCPDCGDTSFQLSPSYQKAIRLWKTLPESSEPLLLTHRSIFGNLLQEVIWWNKDGSRRERIWRDGKEA